ncbi:PREDICTED: mitochondrial ubiquitin ligase activator of nfkb 1 [Dufourea novaeangliae]|uniref:RING-type E3 ubiquitin transferase n=1 Tax=Dufourea novaeangliae TaxID=178035 RepID=A0A154PJB2_DUFNO|nr:PREDICTED: mitochondrial ubiquitin ligase activator of nfkb 1 [Dufourea novaeangliae]KZC11935.1 Mitochondrial ubiquitin ligase activator of nfkb 1 [Dufourea novaeangliae]
MDYLGEIIAVGIDSVIFGICLKQFFHCKNAVAAVKDAEFHEVGPQLGNLVNESVDNKVGYVAIRGIVKPLGKPLTSINNKRITGVVQKLKIKEHVVARTTAGFWSDQERTVHKVFNTVPFALEHGPYSVEILEPLSADILDMDVVSNTFEPTVPSFADHLWGFFTGVRQRGLQSTEELLREGALITGIGELSRTKSKTLTLQPPLNGTPFYLTSMSVSSLLKKLDDRKKTYRLLCFMFGAIGLLIGGILFRRYWKDRTEQRLAEELRQSLAASRKEGRQRVRDTDLREDQMCVVCRSNPREIILLPCGHVCLCEDCAENITNDCPVCRAPISQKAAAYIS